MPSIREQILEHVRTTLLTIATGNGYTTTLGTVTRGHLSPLEQFGLPFASILVVSDTPEYGPGVLRRTLAVAIRLWIDDAPLTAATTLEALLADVQTALAVDLHRGGLAQHTLEQSVQYVYDVSTERLAGADVTYDIAYLTHLFDPDVGL